MKDKIELKISENSDQLYKSIAQDFMQRAHDCIAKKGVFTVALSGGSTPKKLFALLSAEPYKSNVAWDKIYFFFGDERYVSHDQPDSNFFTARHGLFNNVHVPMAHVFPMRTDCKDPNKAALDYAATLRSTFNVAKDDIPCFDLVYLGLGTNAHTASLMPDTDLVKAYARAYDGGNHAEIVAACWVEELNMYRITFTPPLINHSSCIAFLVEGAEKAKPVWEILIGPFDPITYPAQLIQAEQGKVVWFLDNAAAAQL